MTAITTRSIPFFNYRDAFTAHENAYVEILRDVIRRGAFIQQQDLADFERNLAEYLGVKYTIGVANATDGLVMALRVTGVGPGDEVLFPSHTMVATAAAVAHCGAVPVPVECGDDHVMDPSDLARALTPRTRCIMPVHLNGRTCDMDAIGAFASEHGLRIIEDAAQALGSTFRGKHAGTFGFAAAFSFYPAKILGCFGDGGAVVTDDPAAAERVRRLRDHGRDDAGDVREWGFNSRLDNFQAAVLDFQFRTYATTIARRRQLAALYDELLRGLPQLRLPPAPGADARHFDVYQNYEIEADRRDGLRAYLKDTGVGTLLPWGGKAVHQFGDLALRGSLPRTEHLFERVLMLPMNMMLSDHDVRYIAGQIREFYGC